MQKTKIEWCDYTINPVKGLCPVGCSYCYARAMYHRFKWDPKISYHPEVFGNLEGVRFGSKVFVGSTIDLFHPSVSQWTNDIFRTCKMFDMFTFIFLTKCPDKLIYYSPFPDNCWIGISITDRYQAHNASCYLPIIEATVKFISYEPLLDDVCAALYNFNNIYFNSQWVVIGQQTPVRKSTMPKVGWIEEIVKVADKADIPVFLKDNLVPVVDQYEFATIGTWPDIKLRQEFPKVPVCASGTQSTENDHQSE